MAQLPALHKACLEGSLEGVRAALAQPDAPQVLQTPDADGRTPLHWAASSDAKHALIEALHAAGPLDVNARDASLWTPLMIASSAGALRVVQWLLAQGADVHAGNAKRITALHYACSKNHVDIVRELLEAGADVNAIDGAQQRPIHRAASAGHSAVVQVRCTSRSTRLTRRRRLSSSTSAAPIGGARTPTASCLSSSRASAVSSRSASATCSCSRLGLSVSSYENRRRRRPRPAPPLDSPGGKRPGRSWAFL